LPVPKIPTLTSSDKELTEALVDAAKTMGHAVIQYGWGENCWSYRCVNCGMTAGCAHYPPPNSPKISGDAVKKKCPEAN